MSTGPYLYDEGPEDLHTGTGRSRRGLLVAIFGGTVLVAVAAAVALLVVRGSAGEQATEAAGVFLAALQQDDVETAYGLLCADERARLQPADVAAEYLRPGTPRIGDTTEDGDAQQVEVRWTDGDAVSSTVLTLVNEGGARVCGTAAAG
ncbi:Rv0361 family membrane protein [Geodermatophilus sp. URMC 64]